MITIKKYVNPNKNLKQKFYDFLNNNDFFDIEIKEFDKEVYFVIYDNEKIIGIRKALMDFEKIYKNTIFYERVKDFIDDNKKSCYFHCFAILKDYRNKGLGKKLLNISMNDSDIKSLQMFSSLMETNTLKDEYFNKYGFKKINEYGTKVVIMKN